ncbi:MAG: DUF1302 domain-containing protein [Desulfobacterales bacterium]|nr:DUF1302 domain-containing protein [Desulfobacterales bacterium]
MKHFAAIFALLFIFLSFPVNCVASDESDETIDEIIKGFDNTEQEASENNLDYVLDGFDDDSEDTGQDQLKDVLEGFEDDSEPVDEENREDFKISRFSADGYFKFGSSFNFAHDAPQTGKTDWRGFSRVRTEVQIDLGAKFSDSWQALISGKGFYDFIYNIKGRDEFTSEVLDNYEKEIEIREAWLQGQLLKNLDIKIGKQIVVWGKSDNIRITDILNPLDMREPGITDIEDLRIPLAMTRLDFYTGSWSLTGIAVHEIRFNKNPEFGSDFYPAEIRLPHEHTLSDGGDNTEFAFALSGIFRGWDIAFYYAYIFDDTPHLEFAKTALQLEHSRLDMMGLAFNIATGNWLLKAEAAYFDGMNFFNAPGNASDKTYTRTDVLAGVEYSGLTNTTVGFEAANRHINNFDNVLEQFPDTAKQDEFQSVLRINRTFLNERLSLTLLVSVFDFTGDDGAFQRFSAEYDLADAVKITGGVVLYQSGDIAKYKNIGDNDRMFFEIKYSF